jgi:hypothetical protein
MPRRDTQTLDLLSWTPPKPVQAFPEERVRAADLRGQIAKLVSAALSDSDLDRETVAERMSAWLGEDVTKNMLDAYASEARENQVISLPRLLALAEVTGDAQRIFQALTTLFGLSVIDDRYLPAIEDAIVADKIEELKARQATARRAWKGPR